MEIIHNPSWQRRKFENNHKRYEDALRLGYFNIEKPESGVGIHVVDLKGWSYVIHLDNSITLNWTQGKTLTDYSQSFDVESDAQQHRENELASVMRTHTEFNMKTKTAHIEWLDPPRDPPSARNVVPEKSNSTLIIVVAVIALFLLVK